MSNQTNDSRQYVTSWVSRYKRNNPSSRLLINNGFTQLELDEMTATNQIERDYFLRNGIALQGGWDVEDYD